MILAHLFRGEKSRRGQKSSGRENEIMDCSDPSSKSIVEFRNACQVYFPGYEYLQQQKILQK